MSCKSKKCDNYKDYYEWENFKLEEAENSYNLSYNEILPSMPDDCSRCKRAYNDMCIITNMNIEE